MNERKPNSYAHWYRTSREHYRDVPTDKLRAHYQDMLCMVYHPAAVAACRDELESRKR